MRPAELFRLHADMHTRIRMRPAELFRLHADMHTRIRMRPAALFRLPPLPPVFGVFDLPFVFGAGLCHACMHIYVSTHACLRCVRLAIRIRSRTLPYVADMYVCMQNDKPYIAFYEAPAACMHACSIYPPINRSCSSSSSGSLPLIGTQVVCHTYMACMPYIHACHAIHT